MTGCSGLAQSQYQANIICAPVDLNAKHASLKSADPNWIGLFLAGSPDVIQRLRQLGKRVFYVTNNSTKHRREYKTKVDKLGFGGDLVRSSKRDIILSLQLKEWKQGQIKHHLSDNWKQTKVKTFNFKTSNKLNLSQFWQSCPARIHLNKVQVHNILVTEANIHLCIKYGIKNNGDRIVFRKKLLALHTLQQLTWKKLVLTNQSLFMLLEALASHKSWTMLASSIYQLGWEKSSFKCVLIVGVTGSLSQCENLLKGDFVPLFWVGYDPAWAWPTANIICWCRGVWLHHPTILLWPHSGHLAVEQSKHPVPPWSPWCHL